MQTVISVQRKLALNMHVKFLLFCSVYVSIALYQKPTEVWHPYRHVKLTLGTRTFFKKDEQEETQALITADQKHIAEMSHVRENLFSGVCDQVRIKPACSATATS